MTIFGIILLIIVLWVLSMIFWPIKIIFSLIMTALRIGIVVVKIGVNIVIRLGLKLYCMITKTEYKEVIKTDKKKSKEIKDEKNEIKDLLRSFSNAETKNEVEEKSDATSTKNDISEILKQSHTSLPESIENEHSNMNEEESKKKAEVLERLRKNLNNN